MKIHINNESDRLTVAAILVKNGYTVRMGKEKKGTGKSYEHFVETVKVGVEGECQNNTN